MPYDEHIHEHDCDHDHDNDHDFDHDFDHDGDNFSSPYSRHYGIDNRSRYGAGLDFYTFFENHVLGGAKKKGSSSGWTGMWKVFSSSYLVKYTLIGLGFWFVYALIIALVEYLIGLF